VAIYLSGKVDQPMPAGLAARYERTKLALLTGWTFDIIDALGLQERLDVLETVDAERKLGLR